MWNFLNLILLSIIFFNPLELEAKSKKYKHLLAVCAIFRDEARFLKEWIEFHHLMGATHFFLYNHFSEDEYLEVLEPYLKNGLVTLIQWPYSAQSPPEWNLVQVSAYNNALSKAKKQKVKWMAVIDTDEFIYPVQSKDLVSYLKKFQTNKKIGAVVAHWQLFGTSDIEFIPPGQLMIELLTKKAPEDYVENSFVKSIVKVNKTKSFSDPHFARYKPPCYAVDQNKKKVKGSNNPYIFVSELRINHYWSRDNQFFTTHKIPRRQGWQEGTDGIFQRLANINSVTDHTIARFWAPLKEKLFPKKEGVAP